MTHETGTTEGINPIAGLAAIAFPGAGHFIVRGEKQRGMWAAAGVLGLFVAGLLIGGISVIDRRDNKVWFIGQALVGPLSFGVDMIHQRMKVQDMIVDGTGRARPIGPPRPPHPDEGRAANGTPVPGGTPPYSRSIGKMNELGTLFTTIAGMLNLIIIVDAAFPSRKRPREREGAIG